MSTFPTRWLRKITNHYIFTESLSYIESSAKGIACTSNCLFLYQLFAGKKHSLIIIFWVNTIVWLNHWNVFNWCNGNVAPAVLIACHVMNKPTYQLTILFFMFRVSVQVGRIPSCFTRNNLYCFEDRQRGVDSVDEPPAATIAAKGLTVNSYSSAANSRRQTFWENCWNAMLSFKRRAGRLNLLSGHTWYILVIDAILSSLLEHDSQNFLLMQPLLVGSTG